MCANLAEQVQVCAELSLAGKIDFAEVLRRLTAANVERYHTDYSRQEMTYYTPAGESVVIAMSGLPATIGTEFSPSAVEAAVRQSQRGEHSYFDFVRKTMAAGCVGYFVQITGQRAIYFGRNGENHVEPFPQTTPDSKNFRS